MKLLAALLASAVIGVMPAAVHAQATPPASFAPPAQLNARERDAYRAVFTDLRFRNWASAAGRLDSMREGLLHPLARALLYTAPESPPVAMEPLVQLLQVAPELPQAPNLARLATLRGATALPVVPEARRLAGLAGQPRRGRPRPISGDPIADELEPLVQPLLIADQPVEAEALFNEKSAFLSEEGRASFQQRIAWVYYLVGNNADSRRLAEQSARSVTEFAPHAFWIAGLAAWRMQEYAAAGDHFRSVASHSRDVELVSAGHYWAARSDMAAGRPERVQNHLLAAARHDETFYGLLAQSRLGVHRQAHLLDVFDAEDWQSLSGLRNARAAVALVEIGENDLAGSLLRHQAQIGDQRHHEPLLHLAGRLNLTGTQMWFAHNGPRGTRTQTHDRYPKPSWRPSGGWRVDPALAFAHSLQESNFRPEAVSPVGARGLMQVRPGTAGDMARARGESLVPEQLNEPAVNMEYGQRYLERLRDQSTTAGLLPRVIAAYNAGPGPVAQWNVRFDQSDPLLFIETIPYWETRGYVPIVLRNYWIYEQKTADQSSSRRALASGLWPRFPGLSGPTAVRIEPMRGQTAMGRD